MRPRPSRRPVVFRPRVEALEDRRVLTCTATFSGSTLTITGDNTANAVVINDNGANTPTFNGAATPPVGVTNPVADPGTTLALSVTCNGVTQNIPAATAPGSRLTAVRINMGRRNDRVTYNLTAGLRPNAQRTITANLGRGNDRFALVVGATVIPGTATTSPGVLGGLDAGSALTLNANGDAGNDSITVNATRRFDIGNNAAAVFNLMGGAGDDSISCDVTSSLSAASASSGGLLGGTTTAGAGALALTANGGGGADTVFGVLNLRGGNTTASVAGNGGDDNLGLIASFDDTDQPQNPTGIKAVLDGGGGFNRCVRTANVTGSRCQQDFVI